MLWKLMHVCACVLSVHLSAQTYSYLRAAHVSLHVRANAGANVTADALGMKAITNLTCTHPQAVSYYSLLVLVHFCARKREKSSPVQVVSGLIHDEHVGVLPHCSCQHQLDLCAAMTVEGCG